MPVQNAPIASNGLVAADLSVEQTEIEYRNKRARLKRSEEAIERLRHALHFASHDAPERAKQIAAGLVFEIDLVRRNPARAQRQLQDMIDDYADEVDLVAAYRERFKSAAEEEADAHAVGLQPRHRAAIKHVADCVERLSAALAEEAAIHREFAAKSRAELKSNWRLPQICGPLHRHMTLGLRDSIASCWSRECREKGLL